MAWFSLASHFTSYSFRINLYTNNPNENEEASQNEIGKLHCAKVSFQHMNLNICLHCILNGGWRAKKEPTRDGKFIVIILPEKEPSISAVDSIENTLNWKEFNKNISFSKSFHSISWRSFAFAIPFGIDCEL